MENKHFALSSVENNKLIRTVQLLFGLVCFAVAVFWLIFDIRSVSTERSLWITIIFLAGFGFYQVWAGLGKAVRFIEINTSNIRVKKTIFLPPAEMSADVIQKIDLFPFKIIFFLKTNKKILLRFSSTFIETNEKIKDELLVFSEHNSIDIEFIEEKI